MFQEIRAKRAAHRRAERLERAEEAQKMKDAGMSNLLIGQALDISEATVRALLEVKNP
jgi:DNA-binding CsgD family transcriptional regulator